MFITIRWIQVLNEDRPSNRWRLRQAFRKASWTASSASSGLRNTLLATTSARGRTSASSASKISRSPPRARATRGSAAGLDSAVSVARGWRFASGRRANRRARPPQWSVAFWSNVWQRRRWPWTGAGSCHPFTATRLPTLSGRPPREAEVPGCAFHATIAVGQLHERDRADPRFSPNGETTCLLGGLVAPGRIHARWPDAGGLAHGALRVLHRPRQLLAEAHSHSVDNSHRGWAGAGGAGASEAFTYRTRHRPLRRAASPTSGQRPAVGGATGGGSVAQLPGRPWASCARSSATWPGPCRRSTCGRWCRSGRCGPRASPSGAVCWCSCAPPGCCRTAWARAWAC